MAGVDADEVGSEVLRWSEQEKQGEDTKRLVSQEPLV